MGLDEGLSWRWVEGASIHPLDLEIKIIKKRKVMMALSPILARCESSSNDGRWPFRLV